MQLQSLPSNSVPNESTLQGPADHERQLVQCVRRLHQLSVHVVPLELRLASPKHRFKLIRQAIAANVREFVSEDGVHSLVGRLRSFQL